MDTPRLAPWQREEGKGRQGEEPSHHRHEGAASPHRPRRGSEQRLLEAERAARAARVLFCDPKDARVPFALTERSLSASNA